MAYNWDRQLLKQLKQHPKAKEDLQDLYSSFWDVFKIMDSEQYSKSRTLVEDVNYLKNYHFFEIPLIDMLPLPEIDLPNYTYQNKLSEDEVFELVHDFYQSLPPLFYNLFIGHYNQRHTHFNFSSSILTSFYSGHTYISPSTGDCFIDVQKTGTISDAIVTTHEYGHIIDYYINPYNEKSECFVPVSEVTSIFMELIAMDFWDMYNKLKNDIENERKCFYSSLIDDAQILRDKFLVVNETNELLTDDIYGDLAFSTFFKVIRKNLELSRKELKTILKNPAYSIMPYTMSSLIALELYHIYQTDPEFAFHLYQKFMRIKANTPEELNAKILELGIEPAKNIDTFVPKINSQQIKN